MESWSSECGPLSLQVYKRNVPYGKKNTTEIWRGMPTNSFYVWLVKIVCHLFITVNIKLFFPFFFLSTCPTHITRFLSIPCLLFTTYYTSWTLLRLSHVFRCKFSSFICEETTGQINMGKSKSKREENIWK